MMCGPLMYCLLFSLYKHQRFPVKCTGGFKVFPGVLDASIREQLKFQLLLKCNEEYCLYGKEFPDCILYLVK